MPSVLDSLKCWLAEGRSQIGEIAISSSAAGYALCHYRDVGLDGLAVHRDAEAALEIARYDAKGQFRPLKSAPNLRRGWRLEMGSIDTLRLALDHFYPAALGTAATLQAGSLCTVPLSETIQRQTGMYRIVNKLSTGERDQLAADVCRSDSGCLKAILWQLAPGTPVTKLPREKFEPFFDQTGQSARVIPIPCAEACNLLIAAGRTMAKAST